MVRDQLAQPQILHPLAILRSGNASDGDNSLPVQLVNFEGAVVKNVATLTWATESELENLGFEIYRSSQNLDTYHLISSDINNPNLIGQGNSSLRQTYLFTDLSATRGDTLWYKLADVNLDGTSTFHNTVAVNSRHIVIDFHINQNYPIRLTL